VLPACIGSKSAGSAFTATRPAGLVTTTKVSWPFVTTRL
jgi:hypothetical protein